MEVRLRRFSSVAGVLARGEAGTKTLITITGRIITTYGNELCASSHQLKTGQAEIRPRWAINAKSPISILDTNDLIVIQ